MYRVVARHPDRSHSDHAWHQVAGPLDYLDEAKALAATEGAELEVAPRSLDPEEPIRPDPTRAVREAAVLGYELKAQELVEGDETSRWKDVS